MAEDPGLKDVGNRASVLKFVRVLGMTNVEPIFQLNMAPHPSRTFPIKSNYLNVNVNFLLLLAKFAHLGEVIFH